MNGTATTQPASSQAGTRDLFLSYNRCDSDAVLRVWELLRARSLTSFFDRNDLTPGLPWQAELECAIAQICVVAVPCGCGKSAILQAQPTPMGFRRAVG